MPATWKKLAYEDDVILKTLADANSVLYATTDNIPAALAMGASTILARLASGDIKACSVAEINALLGVSGNHNLFSTTHADTTGAASPVDGDMIIGNATPAWSKVAISVPAAGLMNIFGVVNAETRGSWKALFDATNPTTIGVSDAAAPGSAMAAARRDHQHASPATFPPASHALSAHSAAVASISMGGFQLTDQVLHLVADAAALAALTAVKGKFAMQLDTAAMYICTAIA
jgi:hypothetical protein